MNLVMFAALAAGLSSLVPVPSRVEPVRIGVHGDSDLDACLSVGRTTSAVVARLAPSETAATSVSLAANQAIFLCGTSSDGAWESIVIPDKSGQDCGVSHPVARPAIYSGPCRTGWIPMKNIRIVAG